MFLLQEDLWRVSPPSQDSFESHAPDELSPLGLFLLLSFFLP